MAVKQSAAGAGKETNIEDIIEETGTGKFQILNYLCICVSMAFTTMAGLSFIFTTLDIPYRCEVPQCETSPASFEELWLQQALPHHAKCERYSLQNVTQIHIACNPALFNNMSVEKCDRWVYGEGDSIVKEFNIPCEDWKISLVGTVNGAGQAISLLLSGVLSDRYGRRIIMAIMTAMIGVIGLIQSFSFNYWFFLTFEFLNMVAVRGASTTAYVLAIEVLSKKQRVYGCSILEVTVTTSSVALGLVAWFSPSWRVLLRIVSLPNLLVLFSLCLIPESFRWLNVKGRKSETEDTLKMAARWNKRTLSVDSISKLEQMSMEASLEDIEQKTENNFTFFDMFQSRLLTIRISACIICWFGNVMLYYGLYLNSVNIESNNPYLNFIYVALVEYLSIVIYTIGLTYVPRKLSMFVSLVGTATFCFVYAFVPRQNSIVPLAVYLVSKVFVSISFKLIYVYTSEMFPTCVRNSAMSLCSVIARVGGATASQVPLLAKFDPALPMCTFGIVAACCSLTVFAMPETKGKELPDTIKDAEKLA